MFDKSMSKLNYYIVANKDITMKSSRKLLNVNFDLHPNQQPINCSTFSDDLFYRATIPPNTKHIEFVNSDLGDTVLQYF